MPTETKYTCYVDGGCYNNGRYDSIGYGSFKIFCNDTDLVHEALRFRLLLPQNSSTPMLKGMTNNVAEAMSINMVLVYIEKSKLLKSSKNSAVVNSDSELTIRQIKGICHIKDKKLLHVAKERTHILAKIKQQTGRDPWECIVFNKIPRETIFEVLGH